MTFPSRKPNDEGNNSTTTEVPVETKMTFPYEEPQKAYIRWKNSKSFPKGSDPTEAIRKIGSSLKGNDSLRGLTREEEDRFLPRLLGVRPESEKYHSIVKSYWDNINAPVPPINPDGSGGLELEIGIIWKTAEDYHHDMNIKKTDFHGIEMATNIKGEPINLSDYILYRYCLVYKDVANKFEDIGKTTQIRFYIYSKEREVKEKRSQLRHREKAHTLFYQSLNNRGWVDNTLRVIVSSDKSTDRKLTIYDVNRMAEDEKDLALETYVNKMPDLFLSVGKDSDLELRASIETAIVAQVLTRIPNTDTVMRDTEILGSNMKEVVAYFKDSRNERNVKEIEAAVKMAPTSKR